MLIRAWRNLPKNMQIEEVRPYYQALRQKAASLFFKRLFDFFASLLLLILLSPVLFLLAIWIKIDSKGSVFFRQTRITSYGKEFQIYKFRTMVQDAEKLGHAVTIKQDPRITRVGQKIRKTRLDELPQLLNVLAGSMSFVGTRPEVPKYVAHYTPEMMAPLLLPAGVTSLASIKFKDEEKLLTASKDPDKTYIETILPQKMKINLDYLIQFRFGKDLKIALMTVFKV